MSIEFTANLPTDSQTPVKPTKDFNPKDSTRRVRIWLDGFLSPGDTEKLLLMSETNLRVTITPA